MLKSIGLFVLAGFAEIGGRYLLWLWLRDFRALWFGLIGATFQPAHFGRVYAAYGGVFIVMAMLWGWGIDGVRPDRWDVIGAALALIGT